MKDEAPEAYSGIITVKPLHLQSLQDFCVMYIPSYNREKYRPLAVRVFIAKETIITVFAQDMEAGGKDPEGHIPVKKFKLEQLSFADFLAYMSEINFTLHTGLEAIDDMRVINR